MANLNLFCLVDGDSTSNAFSVKATSTDTVDDLKEFIKAKKSNDFHDVDADRLTLWHVSVSITAANKHNPVTLDSQEPKEELLPSDELCEVFPNGPARKTVHIIVQRPPLATPVHIPAHPSRSLTPVPGSLSDGFRPGTPLSGDLRVDIKKITDKFFAPGTPVANFLHSFVRGHGTLPVTTGTIRGLPRAWRRAFGKALETNNVISMKLEHTVMQNAIKANFSFI
ncbi:hypothetical protein EDD21DRAFT_448557 [Dissophora ornata]|nr:hypothetical protein EDD21DRAFT_448557 [Dissophora ornata]